MDISNFKVMGNTESDSLKIKINDDIILLLKYPRCELQSKLSEMTDVEIIKECLDRIYVGDEEVILPKEESPEELEEFIESLPLSILREAEEFYSTMPFLGHQIDYTCKNCNKENFILINGYEHFFG